MPTATASEHVDSSQRRPHSFGSALYRLALLVLGLAATYLLVVPLFRPRGVYGWGHYRLLDIYAGTPVALLFIGAAVVAATPPVLRRGVALRLVLAATSIFVTLFTIDVAYVLAVGHIWHAERTDMWFDPEGVTHRDNLPDEELGFVRKPRLSWRGQPTPGARTVDYRTDENGFRNPLGLARANVAFIGDSFTEGATVQEDDTYVLQVGIKTDLSVVNLGVGYYGPQQELIILKRFALSYHPKAVVWELFEGNDLTDAERYATWKQSPDPREPLRLRYTKNSLVSRFIARTAGTGYLLPRSLSLPGGKTGRVYLDYTYVPDQAACEKVGFAETKRVVEAGYRLCQSEGVRLLVLFVPVKVRVLAPYVIFQSEQDRNHWLPGGKTESRADFGTGIHAFCNQLGCPFVDAYPLLRERAASDCREIYASGRDSHLDVRGHQVVSDAIVQWLRSTGITAQTQQALRERTPD